MRLTKQNFIIILLFMGLVVTGCNSPSEEEIEAAWESSAHADTEATAFTRWDNDDPPQVPVNCAKCHSTIGYHDFLGLDGATPGQVDNPAAIGTTVACEACHNEISDTRTTAVMPSHIELTELGQNSDCMECHQGRASGIQMAEAINGLPADELDTELRLPGVHNGAAGPTLYGSQAQGGYQYEGKMYAERYPHIVEFRTCNECHNAHTLQIDPERCGTCHLGVRTADDFVNIRSSRLDYDADGNISEGMAGEITTMEERLLISINRYIAETDGVEPIVISRRVTNEAGDNYTTWTPRLMRAVYNYQYSTLDSGGYSHNPHYTLQLLYDSIDDLGGSLSGLIRP